MVTKRNVTTLTYHMKSFYKFSNNEYRPAFVDLTTDFCGAELGMTSIMHSLLKDAWRNLTNIFRPCPFLCGEYYLKDFNFAAYHLPSIVPAGRYFINTTLRVQSNEFLGYTLIYFYINNHGVLDLEMG